MWGGTMALTLDEKEALLQDAIREVKQEYALRSITPQYATATFMVFAHLLKHWFKVPEDELLILIRVAEGLDITTTEAKSQLN
jgi:hypothetical protein